MTYPTSLHELPAWLALHWESIKSGIEYALAFDNDALHVIIGVVLQLIFAAMLRSSISRPLPWLLVLLLELANEASDLALERWPEQAMQYGEGMKDILLTMALPTLLLVVARWRSRLLR